MEVYKESASSSKSRQDTSSLAKDVRADTTKRASEGAEILRPAPKQKISPTRRHLSGGVLILVSQDGQQVDYPTDYHAYPWLPPNPLSAEASSCPAGFGMRLTPLADIGTIRNEIESVFTQRSIDNNQ